MPLVLSWHAFHSLPVCLTPLSQHAFHSFSSMPFVAFPVDFSFSSCMSFTPFPICLLFSPSMPLTHLPSMPFAPTSNISPFSQCAFRFLPACLSPLLSRPFLLSCMPPPSSSGVHPSNNPAAPSSVVGRAPPYLSFMSTPDAPSPLSAVCQPHPSSLPTSPPPL